MGVITRPGLDDQARDAVAYMASGLRHGDADGVTSGLMCLLRSGQSNSIRMAASVVLQACAVMVTTLASAAGAGLAIDIRLVDQDRREVPLGEAGTGVHAMISALLSEVDGARDTAEAHLDVAFAGNDSLQHNVILLGLLDWAADLLDICEEHRLPTPQWLSVPATLRPLPEQRDTISPH